MPTPWAKVKAAANVSSVTTRMEERLRERRSAHRRLVSIKWGRALLATGVAAAAVWLVLLSPVFAFDGEQVEAGGYGTVVSPEEVAAIVAEQEGTSLVLLNTDHVENQLEALVGVREADVERVWPAGLRVTLSSAEPVAAIPASGGGFALVDERGAEVAHADDDPGNLPVITIPLDGESTRILDGVLGVIAELPPEVLERVRDIEAATEDSIQFGLTDGPRVEWGSVEDSALKAEVLDVLLQEEGGADLIDVSAPTLPTVS